MEIGRVCHSHCLSQSVSQLTLLREDSSSSARTLLRVRGQRLSTRHDDVRRALLRVRRPKLNGVRAHPIAGHAPQDRPSGSGSSRPSIRSEYKCGVCTLPQNGNHSSGKSLLKGLCDHDIFFLSRSGDTFDHMTFDVYTFRRHV